MKTTKKNDAFSERSALDAGFTLLEILLVLALLAVLLAGLSAIIRLYSGHYSSTERRVGRAQLTRSISQMLSDDLGAAVQDPILSTPSDPNRQFIRRFGLRGDSRSLQIDVVQPNLFATTATAEENRAVAAGGQKSANSRQVPELKTIFYEFVPINAREGADKLAEAASGPSVATTGAEIGSGENLGSELSGGLLGTSVGGDPWERLDASSTGDGLGASDLFGGGVESLPLVRKYGLSRRELDFETPEDATENDADLAAQDAVDVGFSEDLASGNLGSSLGGSLSAPPSTANSTLASAGAGLDGTKPTETAAALAGVEESSALDEPPPTAAQIAVDADDGTTWAPEVLDCRFRYFDGENWLNSWDSIEKEGLPIAIKVELKLAPLDDVDLYRESPLLFQLPIPPTPSELEKILTIAPNAPSTAGATDFSSEVAGSLSAFGQTGQFGAVGANGKIGVDAFNSYRPAAAFRLAKNAPAFERESVFSPLQSLASGNGGASDSVANDLGASSVDVVGSLGGSGMLSGASGFDALETPDAATQSSLNAAVFNERGVCVDFANDGSYLTLEQMARELGLSEPTVCEVVAYLPTTPLGRTKTLERRRSANVRVGAVANPARAGVRSSSAERNAAGANPYSTGTGRRQVQNRTRTDRAVANREVGGRSAERRTAATRGDENRSTATRTGVSRNAATRAVESRGGTERVATNRRLQTRGNGGSGNSLDSEIAAALDAEGGVLGSAFGATEEFAGTEPVGSVPNAGGLGAATVGGLSGPIGATHLSGIDPFEIVDSQNVPFSNESSGFSAVDSALGAVGGVAPDVRTGFVETPNGGVPTIVSPTARPDANSGGGTKQTWIRGKK